MSTQVYKHTLRNIMELILASGRQTEIGFKRYHNLLELNLLKMEQSVLFFCLYKREPQRQCTADLTNRLVLTLELSTQPHNAGGHSSGSQGVGEQNERQQCTGVHRHTDVSHLWDDLLSGFFKNARLFLSVHPQGKVGKELRVSTVLGGIRVVDTQ